MELHVRNIKFGAVDKNIYCEKRGDSLRIVVQVSPQPKKSITVSNDAAAYERGLVWAHKERDALRDVKKGKSPSAAPVIPEARPPVAFLPGDISIRDILDNYRQHRLAALGGSAQERSRLKNLEQWFGHLKLGGLPPSVIAEWKNKRQAGLLGSGRVRKTDLTKHQRHYRKQHSASDAPAPPPEQIAEVSPQTVRHELVLLRRTITSYFEEKQLDYAHGAWLRSLAIMKMELPERPDPRETRLTDEQLERVLRAMPNREHQCYVLLAISTTLRRGELCSLLWEDVDLKKNEIRLRAPGHRKKSKVAPRAVPLMPGAVEVLKKLGPRKSGLLFSMTPGGYSQAWRRAADLAGCPDVRLHDMRREGISRLVELVEAPLQSVVAFTGHSDVGVLQRHYIKPRADIIVGTLALREGADRLLVSAMKPAT
jgi:integrase